MADGIRGLGSYSGGTEDDFAHTLARPKHPQLESVTTLSERLGQLSDIAQVSDRVDAVDTLFQTRHFGLELDLARRVTPETPARLGFVGQSLNYLGPVFNSITGILDMKRGYDADLATGDTLLPRTLKASVKSTTQIAAGTVIGTATGAVAATVGGAALLPVAIGVGVGIGASYVVGKAVDYLSNWLLGV